MGISEAIWGQSGRNGGGGVFRRLLNLVLIVYWLWFSAEDTPSAKIENGTPCSGQFSGPARVPVEIPSQTLT